MYATARSDLNRRSIHCKSCIGMSICKHNNRVRERKSCGGVFICKKMIAEEANE